MARARNIKPNIMANESLGELPPLTRLLFIYLWMLADRDGRLEDMREDGRDQWSHRAVYWAAVEFGTWDLRNASWQTAKGRWTRLLTEKLTQQDLPEVPPRRDALPAPGQGSADPEKVRALISDLRKKLGIKAASQPAWKPSEGTAN